MKRFLLLLLGMISLVYGIHYFKAKPEHIAYRNWRPVLKTEDVFKSAISFSFLQTIPSGDLFWIEQRPHENGRSVLVSRNKDGLIQDLTPTSYSVKTRINEYAGFPYAIHNQWIYFVNEADQRIYKQNRLQPNDVRAITIPQNNAKLANLTISPDGRWLVFVYEKESLPNYIGIINLESNQIQEPKIVMQGAKFYNSPSFSPDGRQLAWLEWEHPYMPWDATHLYIANFVYGNIDNHSKIHIAGSTNSSILSYTFTQSGIIYYAQNFANKNINDPLSYYNIYQFKDGRNEMLTRQFGDFEYLSAAGDKLLVLFERQNETRLELVDPTNKSIHHVARAYNHFGNMFTYPVWMQNNEIATSAFAVNRPNQLILINNQDEIHVVKEAKKFNLAVNLLNHFMTYFI